MGNLSKLLQTDFKYLKCARFVHPGKGCSQAAFEDSYKYIPGNVAFVMPFVVLPLVVKLGKLDKELLKETLWYFAELFCSAYAIGYTVTSSICILRNLLGKFTYFTVAFWPAFIAGCWGLVIPNRAARLISLALTQVVMEAQLRDKKNLFSRALGTSKHYQTLLFMICSAIIIQTTRHNNYKSVWFVKPPYPRKSEKMVYTDTNDFESKQNEYEKLTNGNLSNGHEITANGYKSTEKTNGYIENTGSICTHAGPCRKHVLQGVKSYFLIGLTLEVTKTIIASAGTKNSFRSYMAHKLKTLNFSSTGFFISVIGIYRASHCILNNKFKSNEERNHTIAAFLSGLSYIFVPKATLLSYAITVAGEMIWRLLKKRQDKNPKPLQMLLNIPVDRLIIPCNLGYIVHLFMFNSRMVNVLGTQIINGATNNKAQYCVDRVQQFVDLH